MKEVFSVDVVIDGSYEVKSEGGSACMITFHGESNCESFKGKILPGGVDTQKQLSNGERTLSARYILEGQDYTGKQCHIFIENNGYFMEDGTIKTKPIIITDSKALSWMTTADLTGTVIGAPNGVRIAFLQED